jgi:antirestriction protein ArdC
MARKSERVEGLLADLNTGIDALANSEQWTAWLKLQSKLHKYSFGNVLLIMAQCHNASMVMGYGSKDKSTGWLSVGRCVRKGERAIWILAPILVDEKKDGIKTGEKILIGYRDVSVFDVSQTDGDDLPEILTKLNGDDGADAFKAFTGYAEKLGFTVKVESIPGETNGYTSYDNNVIAVETSNDQMQQTKTLAHELGHALLHNPSDQTPIGAEIIKDRAHKELEAESVAFIVMGALGCDSGDYSFGYVTHWSKGAEDAHKGIKASAARIQRAAHKIIDAVDH